MRDESLEATKGRLIERHADAELERQYVEGQREAARPALIRLVAIAFTTIGSFFVLNPFFLSNTDLRDFNIIVIAMLLVQAGYFVVVWNRWYVSAPIIDFLFFTLLSLILWRLSLAEAVQARGSGWPFSAVLALNIVNHMAFSVLAFVANTRWHAAWVVTQLAIMIAALMLHGSDTTATSYLIAGVTASAVLVFFANRIIDSRARRVFDLTRALAAERREIESLLYNVLPGRVADRLRRGETVADAYDAVTLVYVDIVGFSRLAQQLPPEAVVALLNRLFSLLDAAAAAHGIEKVKTIGDAYLAIAGAGPGGGAHGRMALAFARTVLAEVATIAIDQPGFSVRIGIHSGAVSGGVIGTRLLGYDYWGETVNLVCRLQEVAPRGGISCTEASRALIGDAAAFAPARRVEMKGIGTVDVLDVIA